MRIGLFTDQYYPSVSGVVTSVKMLYEGLTAMGHECFIFTSYDEKRNDGSEELTKKNIVNFPGRPYPFKNLRDYRYTLTHGRFVKTVEKYNLDVIHVHTEYSVAKIALKAARKLKIPIVYTLHTLWNEFLKYVSPICDKLFHGIMFRMMTRMFAKPVCRCAAIHVVPTRKVLDVAKSYGVGRGKGKDVRVIPTGIDLDRFAALPPEAEVNELKRQLGVDGKFVFTYVGRVSKEKNISLILRSFAKAFGSSDDVCLIIVDGGPDETALKREAEKLGVADKTVFTGMVAWERVPLYYRIGDVFVNASSSETQGLTYIEALAAALPPLAIRDKCLDGVITDGDNGMLFANEDDLTNKMQELSSSPKLVSSLKSRALPSIKKYSKEAYAESILGAYNDAISLTASGR